MQETIAGARVVKAYVKEVKEGSYPSAEHTYAISDDVMEKLY